MMKSNKRPETITAEHKRRRKLVFAIKSLGPQCDGITRRAVWENCCMSDSQGILAVKQALLKGEIFAAGIGKAMRLWPSRDIYEQRTLMRKEMAALNRPRGATKVDTGIIWLRGSSQRVGNRIFDECRDRFQLLPTLKIMAARHHK